jgi:hypothetical protein
MTRHPPDTLRPESDGGSRYPYLTCDEVSFPVRPTRPASALS